ncbi:MAG TPA: hypothetical protein VHG93_19955, partial [Longimicrobium sp.]|nr:hypothetical protein [Longimicrobium sp.]
AAAPALEPQAVPGGPDVVRAEEPDGALAEASGVLPFRRRETVRRRPPVPGPWLAAAAAVILVVSVLALQGRASPAPAPVQLAARLEGGLPARWANDAPWQSERGGDSGAERNARAARAGVMMVWLATAAQAGDSAQTRVIAGQMVAQIDPGAGPGTPLQKIRERPGASPDSLRAWLQQATTRLEKADGRDYLRVAAWAEAARLAARGREPEFFASEDTGTMLDRAGRLARDDEAARAAVAQVRAALPAGAPPNDWAALETSLETFLREIAS